MKYMLPQINLKKKKKLSMTPQPNLMESNIFKTHPPNIKKTNFHAKKKENHYSTFVQLNNENQYWHEDLLLFEDDEDTSTNNTSWLGSQHMDATMKILYETKLQHQGYESHQYSSPHSMYLYPFGGSSPNKRRLIQM